MLVDHNSRLEREKVVFFLMQVAISKFTLFEVPGCSSHFFYSKDFAKRKSKLL